MENSRELIILQADRDRPRGAAGRRSLQVAICAMALAFEAHYAVAAGAGRVAVVVDGADGDRVRAELIAGLPAGTDAITPARNDAAEISRLADMLARQKLDDPAFATAESNRRRVLIKKLRKVAGAIGVHALIAGTLTFVGRKGPQELQLIVVVSSKDDAVLDQAVRLRKAEAARARQLKYLLAGALDGKGGNSDETTTGEQQHGEDGNEPRTAGTPREKTNGTSEENPEDHLDEASSKARASLTDALLVGFGGLDFGGRQFHYNQRITNATLRPYDLPQGPLLPVTPGAAISAELYPFARMRLANAPWSVARDIGITSHLNYNLAKAQVGSTTLKTTWYAWDVNLRVRWHLGDRGSSPVVGLQGGLGELVFAFKGDPAVANILPNVDYHDLRFGADCRIPVKHLAVFAGAAYRHLLNKTGPTGGTIVDAGSLGEHFPRADIQGLDAHLGGSLPLAPNLEARLVLGYVRYWASFHSRPGDTYIAGGGLEQIVHADLGIAAFF